MIALAHFKDESALEDLVDLLNHDSRPMIRATAAWAIRMIAGKESKATLEEALKVESDDTVKTEIEKAFVTVSFK
jgi:epoxyqueuosine reductase